MVHVHVMRVRFHSVGFVSISLIVELNKRDKVNVDSRTHTHTPYPYSNTHRKYFEKDYFKNP